MLDHSAASAGYNRNQEGGANPSGFKMLHGIVNDWSGESHTDNRMPRREVRSAASGVCMEISRTLVWDFRSESPLFGRDDQLKMACQMLAFRLTSTRPMRRFSHPLLLKFTHRQHKYFAIPNSSTSGDGDNLFKHLFATRVIDPQCYFDFGNKGL